jgi:hypothetical protein
MLGSQDMIPVKTTVNISLKDLQPTEDAKVKVGCFKGIG